MDCLQLPFIRVEETVSWTQRYDKQIWKEMFAEILRFKETGKRML